VIRKKTLPAQEELWVARDQIKRSKGSRYYDRLAADLDKEGFGDYVRGLCEPYYHHDDGVGGRPPIDPEVYFKMLMVGFFEKIGSERGIASRCEDSLSIRRFLRYDLTEGTPDHSSLSVIRQRLPLEVFEEAFTFSLRPLRKAGLLKGEAIGVDSSTVEANASLEKLTRREDGKSYREYIGELAAEAEGIDSEDSAAVADFDRRRKDKKVSNEEWFSPNDPDAKIGPRKDGAWDMIHKVENAVDLDSGAILSVEVQPATKGDATDMAAHFGTAAAMVDYTAALVDEEVGDSEQEVACNDAEEGNDEDDGDQGPGGAESGDRGSSEEAASTGRKRRAVGDKGYHKNEELAKLVEAGFDPNIAEPAGRQVPKGGKDQAAAFEANRENRQSEEGRELLRRRGEKVERSFRHLLDHGGARRTTLSGHEKIAKRLLITALGFNLSIYSWYVHGVGTVKQSAAGNRNKGFLGGLQSALNGLIWAVNSFLESITGFFSKVPKQSGHSCQISLPFVTANSTVQLC
jgi:transposase